MKKLFGLLFTFVFFIQFNAWAIGESRDPESTLKIEKFVSYYNALTDTQKQKELDAFITLQTKSDQAYFSSVRKHLTIPQLEFKGGKVYFKINNSEFNFEHISKTLVKFKGEILDVKRGSLAETAKELEMLLTKKKFSLMDLVISPVYAGSDGIMFASLVAALVIILIGMFVTCIPLMVAGGAVGLAGMFLATKIPESKEEDTLEKACRETKEKMANIDNEYLPTEVEKKEAFKQALFEAWKDHPLCADGNKFDACKIMARCLEELKQGFGHDSSFTDSSDRGSIKEINAPVRNQKIDPKSSKQ